MIDRDKPPVLTAAVVIEKQQIEEVQQQMLDYIQTLPLPTQQKRTAKRQIRNLLLRVYDRSIPLNKRLHYRIHQSWHHPIYF